MKTQISILTLIVASVAASGFGRAESSTPSPQYQVDPAVFGSVDNMALLQSGRLLGRVNSGGSSAEIPTDTPATPGAFVAWAAQKSEVEEQQNAELATQLKSQNLQGTVAAAEQPEQKAGELNISKLGQCASKAVPLMRLILGYRQMASVAKETSTWLRLSDVTQQSMGALKAGQLPCANFAGALQHSLKLADTTAAISEHVLTLSVLMKLPLMNERAQQLIIEGVYQAFVSPNSSRQSPFWQEYWAHLTVDSLLRHQPLPLTPIEFAQFYGFRDSLNAIQADQNEFHTFATANRLLP